jgi:hypothetical protein
MRFEDELAQFFDRPCCQVTAFSRFDLIAAGGIVQ